MNYHLRNLIIDLIEVDSSCKMENFLTETRIIQTITLIDGFNRNNINTFKFGKLEDNKNNEKFTELLTRYLRESWDFLNQTSNEIINETLINLMFNLVSSCLDLIRLISRDTETIFLFENSTLLDLIQFIANLSFNKDLDEGLISKNNKQIESINLAALKSISNLIYNSKFVQDFYVNNNVAEKITIFLKQFSFNNTFGLSSFKTNNNLNIMTFNLRILFLLSVFNKDLRFKLREKLQVVTYLIEIIDLIMKERLSLCESECTSKTEDENNSNHHNELTDYCHLYLTDLDFINELLKILYNLTIDIAKPVLNFSANNNEEEEAHLMHLVSVLRDLITCRIREDDLSIISNDQTKDKLNDLHSNIINLLTNMPSVCFEELMTPCNPNTYGKISQNSESLNYYYVNARLAHNKMRLSRRSKRLRIIQENSSNLSNNELLNNYESIEFEGKNIEAIGIIISFMNRRITMYLNKSLGYNSDQIHPVLLLLSLMSKSNKIIRHYTRMKILPPLRKIDLINLPQNGPHIRNHLVRLMTDSNLSIKRLSAQLLFILCKESIKRLVKYTGYGNAAGLLAEAGLMLSTQGDRSAYSSDSNDSETEDYKELEECINPITGRAEIENAYLDKNKKKYIRSKKDLFEGLTEEQKEYEAIQLVNVIDKLTKLEASIIKPATIGSDGKPIEIQHVLQLQEQDIKNSINKINEFKINEDI